MKLIETTKEDACIVISKDLMHPPIDDIYFAFADGVDELPLGEVIDEYILHCKGLFPEVLKIDFTGEEGDDSMLVYFEENGTYKIEDFIRYPF